MIVTNFWEALQAGKEISNAKAWKNAQLITNKVAVIGSALLGAARLFGYDFGFTDAQMLSLATVIGGLVGVFNGAATAISSAKVGVRRVPHSGTDGGGQGGTHDADPAPVPKRELDADVFDTGYRG